MTNDEMLMEYKARYAQILEPLAARLVMQLQDHLKGIPRVDRITARAKSPDRFLTKASRTEDEGTVKYAQPFEQIQDLVGARVIVFYKQDVDVVSATIERYYKSIELRTLIPESEREFGYIGKHFVLAFPEDLFGDADDRGRAPVFFELQVKTLFQHAWSEAEHDLSYKPAVPLTKLQKRQVALTAAQAWGSDQLFAQMHTELNGAPPAVG
ncbi:GTP pyrophosphokinase [Variovorax sp. YR566]|uniref:GTP pyrophosphokinase n=1 Tax=Variovorax sp. YR566 TaxID=3450237 RepID=UPI003F8173C3